MLKPRPLTSGIVAARATTSRGAARKKEVTSTPAHRMSKAAKRFFEAVEHPKKPNKYLKKMFRLYGSDRSSAPSSTTSAAHRPKSAPPKPVPRTLTRAAPTERRYLGTPSDHAQKARRERIETLWRSGEVDPGSGLPAFLDRSQWG